MLLSLFVQYLSLFPYYTYLYVCSFHLEHHPHEMIFIRTLCLHLSKNVFIDPKTFLIAFPKCNTLVPLIGERAVPSGLVALLCILCVNGPGLSLSA